MQADAFNPDDELNQEFTAEDIEIFDQRRQRRLSGESKTYSWQEARDIITGSQPIA